MGNLDKRGLPLPWHYDEQEICYFPEGSVVVTLENGEPVRIGKGDLVTFPKGMDCVWEIREPVRKHYLFGQHCSSGCIRSTD